MVLHWFRRDLRLNDNRALELAKISGEKVQCIFIFDPFILNKLEDKSDPRVTFIHNELIRLDLELRNFGSSLWVLHGDPYSIIESILDENPEIRSIYCNNDYEPYSRARDKKISELFKSYGKDYFSVKDHVIFEKNEISKDDGSPYMVFTPYARRWSEKLKANLTTINDSSSGDYSCWNKESSDKPLLTLNSIGFSKSGISFPERIPNEKTIINYDKSRNFPSWDQGTSRLGIHLRFGTISIRSLVKSAMEKNDIFLTELIWRDFYQMVLFHNPQSRNKAIKPQYDKICWIFDVSMFEAWCTGETGYPLVDAGMRELNATGYMHNRVRMVVASFLTKHLLHDWRLGEAYFAKKLLDFDLASNVGGWQWASGSGCDAAPYFRIFNPLSQHEKFDKQNLYVKKWIPELNTGKYAKPIIDHKFARERALRIYKEGLSSI
jgi:deoxyribodipyrimidine photo-lyase